LISLAGRLCQGETMSKGATAELTVQACQHCGGKIEFDARELPADGQMMECPHCNANTRLRVARPSIAQKINPRITGKALETKLNEAGDGFLTLAIVGVLLSVAVALFLFSSNAIGSAVVVICAALCLFLASATKTVFRALAELVRLAKDQSHFQFEGKITGQKIFSCSICKADVQDGKAKCPACATVF